MSHFVATFGADAPAAGPGARAAHACTTACGALASSGSATTASSLSALSTAHLSTSSAVEVTFRGGRPSHGARRHHHRIPAQILIRVRPQDRVRVRARVRGRPA